MKKKFISLLLVFIFSFGLLSGATQEKTEAISIVGGISIVKVIGMLLGGATLIAGGAVVGDSIINPDDNHAFTDWLQNEYVTYIRDHQQLPGQPPPDPKDLTPMEHAALSSLLTEQGIHVGSELYEIARDYAIEQSNIDQRPDPLTDNIYEKSANWSSNLNKYNTNLSPYYGNATASNNYTCNWLTQYNGAYLKVQFNGGNIPGSYVYFHLGDYGHSSGSIKYPYYKIITPDNNSIIVRSGNYDAVTFSEGLLSFFYGTSSPSTLGGAVSFTPNVEPIIETNIPDIVDLPDVFPEPENFTPTFKGVDLSPLSGLVTSNQEMIDIITGNKQVSPTRYNEIQEAWNEVLQNYLKNPNFTGNPTEPVEPKVNPTTGLIDYEDLPEQPNTDPENEPTELTALNKALYWLKGIWYGIRDLPGHISDAFSWLKAWINTFWTKVNTLIDDFWMRFSTWWQDNFVVHWTAFIDWLHTLPGLISGAFTGLFDLVTIPLNALVGLLQDVWNWLQGVPEMIYGLFVPPSTDIAEVWDPLILLWNDKLEPVKAPLDQLLFYETELQDISANLEFNGIGGTYKIIDYQYVKSVKDQVKGIIRAFFWILIIFFNVDQVHRLIRNQGIIKSYVRKLDEPGGKN